MELMQRIRDKEESRITLSFLARTMERTVQLLRVERGGADVCECVWECVDWEGKGQDLSLIPCWIFSKRKV